jgi:hypothetical protein
MWDNLGQIETFNADGPVEVPPSADEPAPSAANRRGGRPATELSAVQLQALGALLSHPTVAAAAAACRISRRTIFRWLQDPKFRTALCKMQHDYVNHAHAGPRGSTAGAVETLREVLNNREAPAGARVSACRATLSLAYDLIQADDMQHRIETLERLKATSPIYNN